MLRIGIDVGGTHTDAVLLDGDAVVASTKALTSADVISGIMDALETILSERSGLQDSVEAVMLGTTQFTNAVIERRELAEVAAIRIGKPSGEGLPPKIGWPEDVMFKIVEVASAVLFLIARQSQPSRTQPAGDVTRWVVMSWQACRCCCCHRCC